jgi:prepilin-type N-terminal cleavage/methylation domain-containing protein
VVKLLSFRGQTLIETLAALAIISIVISAIATSVTSSLSNATFNQSQTLATKYAQQGTELITQIRDEGYTTFKGDSGIYCLGQNATSLGNAQANCSVPNFGQFIRSVLIQQNGCAANVSKVTITVAFTDGKCQAGLYCHNETDTSCLSTISPVQAP